MRLQKATYKLVAGMFIDDEQLIPRAEITSTGTLIPVAILYLTIALGENMSKLVIRPRLYLCGKIVPISLLQNVELCQTMYLFLLLFRLI